MAGTPMSPVRSPRTRTAGPRRPRARRSGSTRSPLAPAGTATRPPMLPRSCCPQGRFAPPVLADFVPGVRPVPGWVCTVAVVALAGTAHVPSTLQIDNPSSRRGARRPAASLGQSAPGLVVEAGQDRRVTAGRSGAPRCTGRLIQRNRFVQITGATKPTNRGLEAQDPCPGRIEGVTSPTWKRPHRSTCWAPTTSCGRSRRASAGPKTDHEHGRSTIPNGTRSKPT